MVKIVDAPEIMAGTRAGPGRERKPEIRHPVEMPAIGSPSAENSMDEKAPAGKPVVRM